MVKNAPANAEDINESESRSVVSYSLQPHGLYSPWNLQAGILEWVPFNFSRGSSQLRSPALQEDSLLAEPKGKPNNTGVGSLSLSPVDLPDPGIEPGSPALQADSLPTELERVGWLELRRLRGAGGLWSSASASDDCGLWL